MPKLKNRYPKNCRDRSRAFSWHNGKRIYHGVWGSPEAEKNYKRFIAALLENPNLPLQMGSVGGVLISELVAGFLKHIEARKMDKTDVEHFKTVVGFLVDVYGDLGVNEFSPKKLKVVRNQMVKVGTLSRPMINRYIGKIRRIFAWGVEEEVVQSNVIHALRTVKALLKGEEGTFDNPPRLDVPDDVVAATLPYLSPTVRAMVIIQRLTGCRPSEICRMTVESVDRRQENGLWYYVLQTHKTKKHIGVKQIPLGRPEQILIEPYLVEKKPSAAVFSPKTAMAELNAERRENRKTKVSPSQQIRDGGEGEKSR